MSLLSRGDHIFSWKQTAKNRPPFEGVYIYLLAILIGYMLADLGTIAVRPKMLPTQPPPSRPHRQEPMAMADPNQFNNVVRRNLFNQDGKIAPALSVDGSVTPGSDAAPVLSQLALKLEGTMVHSNPKKSVASINVKAKNLTSPYRVDDDLEGLARITAIERRRVIFRNSNSNRLEYIEIPQDSAITFGMNQPKSTEEVVKKGDFDFSMRRADINKYTADLGSILQQARVVPNIAPGSGGRIDGFKFVHIQPGSIFEKLGFNPGDVIKKVNGEEVSSPNKAMQMYQALKGDGRITLNIERNGREETMTYNINE